MSLLGDFENGAGTYSKVVRFAEPANPDGFVVLYLRSKGLFLFAELGVIIARNGKTVYVDCSSSDLDNEPRFFHVCDFSRSIQT